MIANAFSFANSSRQLSNKFADGFSGAALAMAARVMVPVPNLIEQHRNNTVNVTRVPLVPLCLLLSLKALYVVAVISLQLAPTASPTQPRQTSFKEQLSLKGLFAAHFDQPALLQAKVVKEMQSRLEEANALKKEKISEPSSPTERSALKPPKVESWRMRKAPGDSSPWSMECGKVSSDWCSRWYCRTQKRANLVRLARSMPHGNELSGYDSSSKSVIVNCPEHMTQV
jgi:hypothetical protein